MSGRRRAVAASAAAGGDAPAAAHDEAVALVLALVRIGRPLFRPGPHPAAAGDLAPSGPVAGPAPRHVVALLHLWQAGTVSVKELADRLGVSLPTASLLGTELVGLGLASRQEDVHDRRRTLLQVAPQGPAAQLLGCRLGPLEQALGRLAVEQRDALLDGLIALGEHLTTLRDDQEQQ